MSVNPRNILFLDTNILVYAFDISAGFKHDLAAQLVKSCWEDETGCLSIQVLQEFFVTVTRKLASPLDQQTAKQIVVDLTNWQVHAPATSDFLQAIELQQEHQISFWDAQVIQSATALGCSQLLSEDLNSGQWYGSVQVINPFISSD